MVPAFLAMIIESWCTHYIISTLKFVFLKVHTFIQQAKCVPWKMYTVILPVGICDKGSRMCPLKCVHVAFLAYKQQCKNTTSVFFSCCTRSTSIRILLLFSYVLFSSTIFYWNYITEEAIHIEAKYIILLLYYRFKWAK